MLKNVFRKTLSVTVALIMVFTTFCFAQPITASAAVNTTSASNAADVNFVVPEAIYLKPTWNSYYAAQQMSFQWYVNNTMNSSGGVTLDTGEASTGRIYFKYAGATKADITFEWLDGTGKATSGGAVRYGDTNDRYAGTAYTMTGGNSYITISAGTSPSMSASQTGAYLRWTATFTDSTDNRVKTATAYTYVYKPYVQPVGTAIKTINDRGSNHWGQNLSWISGVHDTDSSALGDYYPNTSLTSSGSGLLVLSSSNQSGCVAVGDYGGLYAQFATGSDSTSRFKYTASNTSSAGWLNQNGSPLYVPDKSFRYVLNDKTGHSSGDDAFNTLAYSPTAVMTVDISRYTNLNQIPNLSLGLFVTDDEASDSGGAWFVANYNGTPTTSDDKDYFKNNTSHAKEIWDRYAAAKDIKAVGSYDDRSASEAEGVKYNGRWPKALSTSAGTSTYYVGTGYFNHQGSGSNYGGDTIWNVSELRMKVTRYDKSTLRTAVLKAIHASATINSAFYDRTSSYWVNYTNLFHAASMALTKLDGSVSVTAVVDNVSTNYTSPSTLASALSTAVDRLLNGNGRISNRKVTQTNIALRDMGDGTYVYAELLGGTQTRTTTFTTYNTVTLTADTVPGYTYVGLVRKTSVPTVSVGITASYPSDFTTSDTGATISGSTVKYQHTDTTGTDGNGNIYYAYYYVANHYTVRYNAGGGSGSMSDQSFTYNVSQNLFENSFSRSGYVFNGWATSSGGSSVYADGQSVKNLTTTANGVVTLYACWTAESYTIMYDTVGGSIDGIPQTTYDINTNVSLPTASKEGHTLVSWRADDSGNWGPMTYNANSPISGKYGNVKFTAVWNANSYTVAFNSNGGSGTGMSNQTFTYGVSQALTACAYSRDGYTFRGWALSSDATDPVYRDKETVQNLTAGSGTVVTLYAVWGTNSYTIVYSTDGGSIRDTEYTKNNYTINDVLHLPVTVEKTGYTFAGWKPTNTAGNWNVNTTYTGTVNAGMMGNVTLQAQWAVQGYTIQYLTDGGEIIGNRYTTAYNVTDAITLPSARKTGYSFGNWKANGIGNWGDGVYAAGSVSAGRYGDVALTAQWTGIQYSVSFNGNSSTGGVMYNQSFVYGEKKALTSNEYSRNGYTYLGWSTNSSATTAQYQDGEEVQNLSVTPNGVVTLFAVWQKNSYTITYDPADGEITTQGARTYTITDSINVGAASRTGYTFTGWLPAANSGSWHTYDPVYSGTVAAGCYGDVTLVAQWTKNTYTIQYDSVGGTISGNYTSTYSVDTNIVFPTIVRSGYAFMGWQASAAWNNILITDNKAPAGAMGNVTLTATWRQQTYYVHFDSNGGTGTMNDQLMKFDESQNLTPNAFSRLGYDFVGWARSANGALEYANGDSVRNLSQTENAIITLYAVWSTRNFSIIYNLNGATGQVNGAGMPNLFPTAIAMEGTKTLRAYNGGDAIVNGQTCAFAGWAFNKADADNGIVEYENRGSFELNSTTLDKCDVDWTADTPTITFYAVWNSVEIKMEGKTGSTTVLDTERKFIYGLKTQITKEELENNYLTVEGNGKLVIVSDGAIGTGTVVELRNSYTNELLDSYQIVIFGDLNGDGIINSTDTTEIRMMRARLQDTSFNSAKTVAADLLNDNNINSTDETNMRMLAARIATIDQVTREITRVEE
ncbi:MAG: InlB B-repeat-containing protein [Clostridia bacterium]|nr:InlB B-repeat-containing protein [Clostridia bacterium]